jgi:hypothetical protein
MSGAPADPEKLLIKMSLVLVAQVLSCCGQVSTSDSSKVLPLGLGWGGGGRKRTDCCRTRAASGASGDSLSRLCGIPWPGPVGSGPVWCVALSRPPCPGPNWLPAAGHQFQALMAQYPQGHTLKDWRSSLSAVYALTVLDTGTGRDGGMCLILHSTSAYSRGHSIRDCDMTPRAASGPQDTPTPAMGLMMFR